MYVYFYSIYYLVRIFILQIVWRIKSLLHGDEIFSATWITKSRKCDNYLFGGKIETVDSSVASCLGDSPSRSRCCLSRLLPWLCFWYLSSVRYQIQNNGENQLYHAIFPIFACSMFDENKETRIRTGRESRGRVFREFQSVIWNQLKLPSQFDTIGKITLYCFDAYSCYINRMILEMVTDGATKQFSYC